MAVAGAVVRPPGAVGVVIVDADPGQRRALSGMIAERTNGRFVATAYASSEEAAAEDRDSQAIVIADLDTVGGPDRLVEIVGAKGRLIATSANGSLSNAIAAMRGGAADFLPKPIGAKALVERLEAVLSAGLSGTASSTGQADKTTPAGEVDFAGFIGRSPAMLAVYEQIKRMAPSRAPVFITGESGTGKEICAEAIHAFSGPAGRPFVAINCSAIPKDLMESEIFGHMRGAFTGASENRAGAAELADGGTLFLDEIAEMDLGLQAKLLRFVQTGKLRRVGGSELKSVDVRIVCATNRDPFVETEAGRLRGDLFYRLHVLPIHLPPLRARTDDILPLATAFLMRFAAEEGRGFTRIDPDAGDRLRACSWPGNVRELANVIRRIVVLHDAAAVSVAMLPDSVRGAETSKPASGPSTAAGGNRVVLPYRKQEQQIIETALLAFEGSIARAAAALEISPSTIYRKLQSWPEATEANT